MRVAVAVTNTGVRAGATVCSATSSRRARATTISRVRTLQAFAKVALAPGASTNVELTLDRRAFATWDVAAHAGSCRPATYAHRRGHRRRATWRRPASIECRDGIAG